LSLEWLDQQASASRSFAALPEVRTALDRVFVAAAKAGGAPSAPDLGRLKSQ
jgi:hypothetical protein